jgi:peptidoglycan/xylan/chitin deacetylase (PgdA/CDA1 family)
VKKNIILAYHRVLPAKEAIARGVLAVTETEFEKQLQLLVSKGYKCFTLKEYFANYAELKTKEKSFVITFDDGYMDNYAFAFKVLKKLDLRATIFLTADYLESDRNLFFEKGEPSYCITEYDRLLNKEEILEMSEYGIEFGSHTLSHPHLTQISNDEAEKEIKNSKKVLEAYLGQDVVSFCYPYGNINERVVELVKEAGYKVGVVTTASSGIPKGPFTLRRTGVYLSDSIDKFKLKSTALFYFIREISFGQSFLKAIKLWVK